MKYCLNPIHDLINENWGEGSGVWDIVKQIRETAYTLRTEEETKQFLQKHQAELNQSKRKNIEYDRCDRILHFIETYFWKYLDGRSPVSELGRKALYEQSKEAIAEASAFLPMVLSEKLFHVMDVSLNPLKVNCTIDRGSYITNFWINWATEFRPFNEVPDEDDCIQFLLWQNFNSPSFYSYVLEHIKKEVDNEDDPDLQEEILDACLLKYCFGPKHLGMGHTPSVDNIVDILHNWLVLEIKQCRKKKKNHNPLQTKLSDNSELSFPKIETSYSVPQLAYFVHILYKAGVITNKVQREMLQAICRTFKTKNTDQIALESLYNKFFNVEDGTRQAVLRILRKMLKDNS